MNTSNTKVVNVKKAILTKNGYNDFNEWSIHKNHVYIGRNMSFYVPGANASKWANPFAVKKYGRDNCLSLYKDYILKNTELLNQIHELEGKELGCWCHPDRCHGDILVEILNDIKNKN